MAEQIGRQDCDTCRKKYVIGGFDPPALRKIKEKGPPCEKCQPPPTEPENETAFAMFQRVGNSDGVRMESLEAAMRIYRVPAVERDDVADRVLVITNRYLKQIKAKREAERAESRDRIRQHQGQARQARQGPERR